jgi:hypothetical protein
VKKRYHEKQVIYAIGITLHQNSCIFPNRSPQQKPNCKANLLMRTKLIGRLLFLFYSISPPNQTGHRMGQGESTRHLTLLLPILRPNALNDFPESSQSTHTLVSISMLPHRFTRFPSIPISKEFLQTLSFGEEGVRWRWGGMYLVMQQPCDYTSCE